MRILVRSAQCIHTTTITLTNNRRAAKVRWSKREDVKTEYTDNLRLVDRALARRRPREAQRATPCFARWALPRSDQ